MFNRPEFANHIIANHNHRTKTLILTSTDNTAKAWLNQAWSKFFSRDEAYSKGKDNQFAVVKKKPIDYTIDIYKPFETPEKAREAFRSQVPKDKKLSEEDTSFTVKKTRHRRLFTQWGGKYKEKTTVSIVPHKQREKTEERALAIRNVYGWIEAVSVCACATPSLPVTVTVGAARGDGNGEPISIVIS